MGERPIFHSRVKKASAVKMIGAYTGSHASRNDFACTAARQLPCHGVSKPALRSGRNGQHGDAISYLCLFLVINLDRQSSTVLCGSASPSLELVYLTICAGRVTLVLCHNYFDWRLQRE